MVKPLISIIIAGASVMSCHTPMLAQSLNNKIEGIWQLTNPSRSSESSASPFVATWKIYYPDGTFKTFNWKSQNHSAVISYSGTYKVVNDSTVSEKVAASTKGEGSFSNTINFKFIGKTLMNTTHHASQKEGTWQELWKKVTMDEDADVLPYLQSGNKDNTSSRDINNVFTKVDQMPVYKYGNERDMMQFIAKNIKYPKMAVENGLQGMTIVRFVVNEKGNTENFQILRSSYDILDKEAIRVIKLLKFNPGTNNGKKVKVYYTLPVSFKMK